MRLQAMTASTLKRKFSLRALEEMLLIFLRGFCQGTRIVLMVVSESASSNCQYAQTHFSLQALEEVLVLLLRSLLTDHEGIRCCCGN